MKRTTPGRTPFLALILSLGLAWAGSGTANAGTETSTQAALAESVPAVQHAPGTVQGVSGGSTVTTPTAVTIYGTLGHPVSKLIIPVVALGSQNLPTPSPLVLDTGSSGMVIDAQDVFPADVVSTDGFVFPPGQNTLTYHGITITKVQASKTYGVVGNAHTDYGNIGFATVKFGGHGELTTNLMPVLFSYKTLDGNGRPLHLAWHGTFGIDPAASAALAPGAAPSRSLNICSPQSINANGCDFVSVLRYLNYAAGVNAGFSLGNAALDPNCAITATMTGCSFHPALTVGLSETDEQAYASIPLICPPPRGMTGSDHGVTACVPNVAGFTIRDSDSGASFKTKVIFDSGTPIMRFSVPPGAAFPQSLADGSTETLTLADSPFSYSYRVEEAQPSVTRLSDRAKSPRTIIGIGFFTDHRMFIDFSSNREGWK
ncbi:hypothetical protein [Caballeronia sp. LZ034LL]|uniref:hypothetical protein n=1 Tax=Caballeronia sp. LZ034LL TaxID=3038567 RepID=UPI0028571A17|nr:hypothetical protein [Caballeronia sp. LZ034LL]MDR5835185.1 hypothetical protein [Caballeronia sp. LZ034LL]